MSERSRQVNIPLTQLSADHSNLAQGLLQASCFHFCYCFAVTLKLSTIFGHFAV